MHFVNKHVCNEQNELTMTTDATNSKGSPGRIPPPLPLVPEIYKDSEREPALTFKIQSIPGDDDSPKITVKIRPLNGSETIRECLAFFREAAKIRSGSNANTDPQYNSLIKRMLLGPALQTYTDGVDKAQDLIWKGMRNDAAAECKRRGVDGHPATERDILLARSATAKPAVNQEMIKAGINALVSYMAPAKVLAKQHVWMRRYCRKPHDMTTKVFISHLIRINKEELPYLPPRYDITQRLSNDDIIDVVIHGIPNRWKREFERSGYDPMESDLEALMKQCERMESLDHMDGEQTKKSDKSDKTEKSGSLKNRKSHKKHKQSQGNRTGDCVIHGRGCGHSTDECKVVLGLVDPEKKKKATKKDGDKKSYGNKSWSRKSDEAKDKTKKELAAFVGKIIKKELNAVQKKKAEKRKKDDDDDSVKSVNAYDLSMIDYENIANLSIDEKAKVSNSEQLRRDDDEFTVSSPKKEGKEENETSDSDLD